MATVKLDGVTHFYGGSFLALKKLNFIFEEGKTYSLLGPSGCGKTTLLNIISGLVRPSVGRVLYNDVDVTSLAPRERNIAQVFQFPVIYQNKTVFENLAFPLRCRRVSGELIKKRVSIVAEILGIEHKLGNSARNLSADEKQLVSLGRGLVREDVSAVMMDEPLTVIDPQFKGELRKRIKIANEITRHTVIYVTHDQNEAMTFADVVLVMKDGALVQSGSPEELFLKPSTTYVGNFIGSPGMNFIECSRLSAVPAFRVFKERMFVDRGVSLIGTDVIGIRPEHVVVGRSADQSDCFFSSRICELNVLGSFGLVDLAMGEVKIKAKDRTFAFRKGDEVFWGGGIDNFRVFRDDVLIS